ncbi:MAG TPA: hypothetical protein VMS93_08670, partial [Candidatus Saccharimonadales bacterium]|nr:hypothetical protein [Candidatus Saccharimonadales bacterium]
TYSEPHVPMGLRVRRTSFAWSAVGRADFVGVHYEITNMTRLLDGVGHSLDSVYVGMYWRPQAGPRTGTGATADDLCGWIEMGANGQAPPDTSFLLPGMIPAAATARDPLAIIHASHADSALHIFWCADDNGDQGVTPGAGAIVLLGATVFPRLGFKRQLTDSDYLTDTYGNAPRGTRVNTYRLFYPSVPYYEGGRPVTDAERWDAMADASQQLRVFPKPTATGTYRALFSTGPFLELAPDSTVELDIAICVGKADYDLKVPFPERWNDLARFRRKMGDGIPGVEFDPHPQSLLEAGQEAWQAWQGRYKANPSWVRLTYFPSGGPGSGTSCSDPQADPTAPSFRQSGQYGRETCIMGEAARSLLYYDCRDVGDETGTNYRSLQPGKCVWFDLDCIASTGACDRIPGLYGCPGCQHLTDHERWVATLPPVQPRLRTVPGDHQIEVQWDDQAEKLPNPVTGSYDFQGYRLYRAAGWKRDTATGQSGPNSDLWQLVGWWARTDSPDQAGGAAPLDSARNRAMGEAATDPTVTCPGQGCRVHPVGYYHFVDRRVTNGFRYFYAVTAYSEQSTSLSGSDAGRILRQESGLAATESSAVVARTDCASDVAHVKVVPNPYRFRAEWDLKPAAADATGTHINFNHLPCGHFTLRIFSAAGDLVRTFHESDALRSGTLEWNLVTRNGQDVHAGIYVYSLESDVGQTVGRFVVIR